MLAVVGQLCFQGFKKAGHRRRTFGRFCRAEVSDAFFTHASDFPIAFDEFNRIEGLSRVDAFDFAAGLQIHPRIQVDHWLVTKFILVRARYKIAEGVKQLRR